MAFYLKYRPQIVEDLDNQRVRELLPRIFSSSLFPHAFLFTGPKGVGKTSTARIIAKILNCMKGSSREKKWVFKEPCNSCAECLAIIRGNHLDILEIDAASNRGIDEIRGLKERISFAPSSAKYKIYIIDEVHMLTTEAFNALLKTLEEPPKHVVFILCTTETHKVPDTIISRCTVVSFSKAAKDEMIRSLSRVVKGEDLKVERGALELIADYADGSFRDGVKFLEQLSLVKKEINTSDVRTMFAVDAIKEKEIIEALINKDAKKTIDFIGIVIDKGIDPKVLTKLILSEFHKELIKYVNGEKTRFTLLQIKKLVNLFSKAQIDMRYSPLPQLPLEMAVVEYCCPPSPPAGGFGEA